jgi:hypothetical protein
VVHLFGQWPRRRSGSQGGRALFDVDRFIADCRAAVAPDSSHRAAREVPARAETLTERPYGRDRMMLRFAR